MKRTLLEKFSLGSHGHRQLSGMIPVHAKVLEIGCSSGDMGHRLKTQKGCTVWGIEIDPARAQKASGLLDRVITADAEDTETWKSVREHFEVILLADVLEHLRDPRAFLSQMCSRLTPGGIVVVSVPNAGHWSVRQALRHGAVPDQDTGILDKTHLHLLEKTSWHRMYRDAGFRVKKWDYTFNNTSSFLQRVHTSFAGKALSLPFERMLAVLWPSRFAYQLLAILKRKDYG